MKFGKSTEEFQKEPVSSGSGGGNFMKYIKDGDNFFHVIDEPSKWSWYWEHYNPTGYPYPCSGERDTCPGCTSDNIKVSKASRRVAFNAYDGEYTNVWKVPKTVGEKLLNRFERIGTITDRPYIVTRMKSGDKYDFDLEGQDKQPLPESAIEHRRDPEELLQQAWTEAWGGTDSPKVQAVTAATVKQEEIANDTRAKLQVAREETAAEVAQIMETKPESTFVATPEGKQPPFEGAQEKVISEATLREMDPDTLRNLCGEEGFGKPPASLTSSDAIVDWMLELSS